ncbi:hypothetical protein ACFWIW_27035 [Amycolatopsis sp. NPDC058340]|uniref:hypothetical protein n=1 Tax=Amycolatopsis sp. NPDC058340 TaxID=3346453 RepID=UPI0036625189
MRSTKALSMLAAVASTVVVGCGSHDDSGRGEPTLDPTSYTTPPTESTGQTTGATTGGSSGGKIIRIGGPNAENRNPSTPWPDIYVNTNRYGCTERHNNRADVPVTITGVRIVGRGIRLVTAWDQCTRMGYTNPVDHGCEGRILQPDPAKSGRGCLLALYADKFSGARQQVVLRLTFQAVCRSAKEKPCGQVPAAKLPATVQWTADETVTARDDGRGGVTTSSPPGSTSNTPSTTTSTS